MRVPPVRPAVTVKKAAPNVIRITITDSAVLGPDCNPIPKI
jgi:hypothetical protein